MNPCGTNLVPFSAPLSDYPLICSCTNSLYWYTTTSSCICSNGGGYNPILKVCQDACGINPNDLLSYDPISIGTILVYP